MLNGHFPDKNGLKCDVPTNSGKTAGCMFDVNWVDSAKYWYI